MFTAVGFGDFHLIQDTIRFAGSKKWSESYRLEEKHCEENDVTLEKSGGKDNCKLEKNLENILVKL